MLEAPKPSELRDLPDKQNLRVFLERYLEGRKVAEIAEELGVSREWCSRAYRTEAFRLTSMQFVRLIS